MPTTHSDTLVLTQVFVNVTGARPCPRPQQSQTTLHVLGEWRSHRTAQLLGSSSRGPGSPSLAPACAETGFRRRGRPSGPGYTPRFTKLPEALSCRSGKCTGCSQAPRADPSQGRLQERQVMSPHTWSLKEVRSTQAPSMSGFIPGLLI